MVLVAQCVYYNRLNKRRAAALHRQQEEVAGAHEDSPLLRRSSSFRSRDAENPVATSKADELMVQVTTNPWVRNTFTLVAVFALGSVSWFISFKAGAWNVGDDPNPEVPDDGETPLEILGIVMGYVSAVCYLWYGTPPLLVRCDVGLLSNATRSARVPQIVKNYREKSCEGV